MTQPSQNVTEAYLLGIKDARETLNYDIARGETDVTELARQMIATIEANLRQGFGGEMRQFMLGGRDFWRNQVKKHAKV